MKSNYVSIGEVTPKTIKIATKIIKWVFLERSEKDLIPYDA